MRLKEKLKRTVTASFGFVYLLSEKLGLVPVWEWLARLDPHVPGPGYSLLISDQYCLRDNLVDASRLLRANILALLGKSYPLPPAPRGNGVGKKAASGDDTAKALSLRDVYAVLEALDVKAFLAFGTLLGYVRENGFIRNDGDLDIGIVYDPSAPDRIADSLSRKGFFIAKRDGSSWPCRIKCIHASGTKVDIIFFHRRNGKFQTYCEYRGRKIFRERACFELKRAEFQTTLQSIRVWIPENPEAFLDENYLDWKVPQAKSHILFTSALTDYRDEAIRYFAMRHLYILLTRRKREHFEFFLDVFLSRNPSDPYWPEIQKAFKAGYAR